MPNHVEESLISANPASRLALERTRLSYDRTMLAWVRTAIALITFGFSIQQFFRIARPGASEGKGLITPHEFGMAMIIIGLMALLLAALQHRSDLAALRAQYPVTEGYPEIRRSGAVLLAGLIAILGMLALLAAIVRE
jgi:putative membrane protein